MMIIIMTLIFAEIYYAWKSLFVTSIFVNLSSFDQNCKMTLFIISETQAFDS